MKCVLCKTEAIGRFPDPETETLYRFKLRGLSKRFISHLYPKNGAYCGDHLDEIRKQVLQIFSPKIKLNMENITIESVDKKVAELEKLHAHKEFIEAFDPAAILLKICAVVTIATPILEFAKRIFFFKQKWQTVIQKVIDISRQVCADK